MGVVAGLALSILTMCTVIKFRHSHAKSEEKPSLPAAGEEEARARPFQDTPPQGGHVIAVDNALPLVAGSSPLALEAASVFPNKLAAISTRPGT